MINFSRQKLSTLKTIIPMLAVLAFSCKNGHESIAPVYQPVSESVYASGAIKSADQYQAYAIASGIIQQVFVTEGDSVKAGEPILRIGSDEQQLRKENAALQAQFSDYGNNSDKLSDAAQQVALAQSRLRNDSALYFRQKALWEQQVGTKVELEKRQLSYEDAKTALFSARVQYNDLNKQLQLASAQAKKNLQIARKQEGDFVLTSKIDGTVYDLYKEKGEQVTPQTPLALIGRSQNYILQLQVDEADIAKVKTGQLVLITMDSYKQQVFEARVTRMYPVMDARSRTFLVEAEFKNKPPRVFPNMSLEANIIINTKPRALLIPRSYVINDSLVIKEDKDTVAIKTGLKDFRMIEVLSGIGAGDRLLKP